MCQLFFVAGTKNLYAQIDVSILNDTVHYNDSVKFTLFNPDSIGYYCIIKLEKYDSNLGYYEYSDDVFSDEGVKRELTLLCRSRDKLALSFIVPKSGMLVEENGTLRQLTSSETKQEKQGLFRLKILYGEAEDSKIKTIYSNPFTINNER